MHETATSVIPSDRQMLDPELLLPLRHEVEGWGEVVRLIFKGVPISKHLSR